MKTDPAQPAVIADALTVSAPSTPGSAPPTETLDPPPAVLGPWSSSVRARPYLLLACLAVLWFIVIRQLSLEWTINAQYNYGTLVPLLCLGLVWMRLREASGGEDTASGATSELSTAPRAIAASANTLWILLIPPVLIIAFSRWILASSPDWRILNWFLAGSAVAITLILIHATWGAERTRRLAAPICLFLVAVPWPYTIELPIIQGLTRANVSATIEALLWFGIPAAQHGNIIEVGTGMVGVDEACSGIRSFQSSLMIGLFLGELYRLRIRWRILLLFLGPMVAFFLNVCRTFSLTWVASREGPSAIQTWHDPAGTTIMIACMAVLWAVSLLLKRGQEAKTGVADGTTGTGSKGVSADADRQSHTGPQTAKRRAACRASVLIGLLVWLVGAELFIEAWYRVHERRVLSGPNWTLLWPPQAPSFREEPVSPRVLQIMNSDVAKYGAWEAGGTQLHLYYFQWLPGKMTAWSSGIHRPEICMAGRNLVSQENTPFQFGQLSFPFTHYIFQENGQSMHVFYCFWEERAKDSYQRHVEPGRWDRLRSAWEGKRNLGQRSIEVMIGGIDDPAAARALVQEELSKLIRVEKLH